MCFISIATVLDEQEDGMQTAPEKRWLKCFHPLFISLASESMAKLLRRKRLKESKRNLTWWNFFDFRFCRIILNQAVLPSNGSNAFVVAVVINV